MRKKYLCVLLALLFYASLLPWSFRPSAEAEEYYNYRAHNIIGDGTGTITGFSGIDLPDNSVTYNHIIFPTDGGYVRFDNSYSAGVVYGLYSNGYPWIRSLIELDDSGEVYLESVRPNFTEFGEIDFSPSANRAVMRVFSGTPLVLGGDNVLITLNDTNRIPTAQLEVDGGMRLNTTVTKPTCDSTQRGTFWVTQAASGANDNVEVCRKDAADAYTWASMLPTTGAVGLSGYQNLKITTPANNQSVSITATRVVVVDNNNVPQVLKNVSQTINLSTNGVNGLDTGTLAANTGYYLYIIYNGTAVAGLASTSATAPSLPSGYSYRALLGWCTTDNIASPFNIAEFTQIDDEYIWNVPKLVLNGGSATTATPIYLSAGQVQTYAVVPPGITKSISGKILGNGGNTNYLNPTTFSSNANAYFAVMAWMSGSGEGSFSKLPLLEDQTFYYTVTSGNSNIYISGFTFKTLPTP